MYIPTPALDKTASAKWDKSSFRKGFRAGWPGDFVLTAFSMEGRYTMKIIYGKK
jgi:hypothetical protein